MELGEIQRHSYNQFIDHNKRLGKTWTPFTMVTKLLEEAGEVAGEILGLEGIKPIGEYSSSTLGRELSDLLYDIFIIAEAYGVDLESMYPATIDKYEKHLFKD